MSPAQTLVLAFIALILAGSGMMYLPFTTHEPISYVDALFTATASVTVVGLAVLDFEKELTTAGQVVVLVLIQLGGLGIVTIASVLILTVRRRLSMGAEDIMGARFSVMPRAGLRGVVIAVGLSTFVIELIGAALLFAFWPEQESIGLRLWHSVFHAISAFCNAGITLFSNGLVGFESNWGVNLTVMVLVVLGGFGFMNLQELTARAWNRRLRWNEFSMFLKVTIVWTAALILMAAVILYIVEDDIAFADMSPAETVLAALFHSVMSRTAGFTTVPVNAFTDITLQVLMVFAFIGASSGSCGGGIKISTLAVLFASIRASLRNVREPIVFNRRLSVMDERKAMVLFFAALLAIIVGLLTVYLLEGKTVSHLESQGRLVAIRLEVVSALSTVGLSTGLTSELSTPSRFVLIALMLIGRLGPLTIITAWLGPRRRRPFRVPEESIPIG